MVLALKVWKGGCCRGVDIDKYNGGVNAHTLCNLQTATSYLYFMRAIK
jgi:hypothetical protein